MDTRLLKAMADAIPDMTSDELRACEDALEDLLSIIDGELSKREIADLAGASRASTPASSSQPVIASNAPPAVLNQYRRDVVRR